MKEVVWSKIDKYGYELNGPGEGDENRVEKMKERIQTILLIIGLDEFYLET